MKTININKGNLNQRGNKTLFQTVLANTKTVGNKEFAAVPTELLFADPEYQRILTRSEAKINDLAKNWNDNKMDALRVVPHNDDFMFSIVDGYGRFTANSLRGMPNETLPCMIIQGAPENKEERRKFEAQLFVTQNLEMEALKPIQKHAANLLLNDEPTMIVERICQKFKMEIVSTGGKRGHYQLGSYSDAYRIAKKDGQECLFFIFQIIHFAGYQMETYGTSRDVVLALRNIYTAYHMNYMSRIFHFLKERSPKVFKAEAIAKYPKRVSYVACTLYIQDYLEKTGVFPMIYMEEGKLKYR